MPRNQSKAAKLRRYTPATAAKRKQVSWNLTQTQIDARLEYCADPDVHGSACVCVNRPGKSK